MKFWAVVIRAICLCGTAIAGEADVTAVRANAGGNGTFTFYETVKHDDTGTDHYAAKWNVVRLHGQILGTRVLYHLHAEEQSFTRYLYQCADTGRGDKGDRPCSLQGSCLWRERIRSRVPALAFR